MRKKLLILSLLIGISATTWAQTNLLSNPGAESNYDSWTKTDGGSGWAINYLLYEIAPHSGNNYWVSSYSLCTLEQTIDLIAAGYSEADLDASPDILAGAYVCTNIDSGGTVTIKVELCDASGTVISTYYVSNNELMPANPNQTNTNTDWTNKSLVISNYGTGVRKINFYLMGQDTRGWRYNYGPAFDDSYVYLTNSPTTDIVDASTKTITVYPNPVSDFVTIEGEKGLVRIYDMNSRMVLTQDVTLNKQINVSSLSKGVYVVKASSKSYKLVKD